MASNYVEILVKARDAAAPELDRLRERLQELGREVETARIGVDDTQAAAKLDRIRAQLAALDRLKDPEIKVSLTGALKAEAQIHAMEASLARLKEKTDEMKLKADGSGPFGTIGKLLFGAGVNGSSGLLGSAGSGLAGLGPMWGGLLAALPVLLPEVTALASGFTAAGVGAGAFYLLAHPTISNLTQDTQKLVAAESALQLAQNKYNVDPTKGNAKALQTASDNLKAIQLSMGQDAGGAAAGIAKLRAEYDKLTTAFAPDVFKVFNAGLRVLNNLLPDVLPFAKTFADVMTGLLDRLDKFTSNPAKKLSSMLNFEDILNPAETFKQQVQDRLNWEQMLNPAGLHYTTQKLHSSLNWEQLLNPAGLGQTTSELTPKVTQVLTPFQQFTDQLHRLEGPALQAIGNGIGGMATAIAQLLTTMSGTDVAHGINIAFGGIKLAIEGVVVAVRGLMKIWDDLSRNPTIHHIAKDIATAWDDISTTGKKKPDFSGLGAALKDAVTTAYDWVYQKLTPLIDKGLKAAGGWLQQNAPKILYPVGKALIQGLISGIEQSIPSLLPSLGHVAAFIAEHKGPLDVDRQLLVPHGRVIMQGLMDGMTSRFGDLRGVLGQAGGVISGAQAGAGGGGGGVLQLQVTGGGSGLDQVFMTWLKNSVRASGGDPAIFTRKVKFA